MVSSTGRLLHVLNSVTFFCSVLSFYRLPLLLYLLSVYSLPPPFSLILSLPLYLSVPLFLFIYLSVSVSLSLSLSISLCLSPSSLSQSLHHSLTPTTQNRSTHLSACLLSTYIPKSFCVCLAPPFPDFLPACPPHSPPRVSDPGDQVVTPSTTTLTSDQSLTSPQQQQQARTIPLMLSIMT